jgi:hypothetical protein
MVVCFVVRFNFVNYALLLLLYLCILTFMYVPFWAFCFIVLFCVLCVFNLLKPTGYGMHQKV